VPDYVDNYVLSFYLLQVLPDSHFSYHLYCKGFIDYLQPGIAGTATTTEKIQSAAEQINPLEPSGYYMYHQP
jgi:hypothetical protein